jgi:hypothetical protein
LRPAPTTRAPIMTGTTETNRMMAMAMKSMVGFRVECER